MRSASTVAAEADVAFVAWWGLPPGWEEVEDADDEVEEPWMTLLNQCSTLGCAWYGDEEAMRPCRRSEPSSSDAEEVSGKSRTRGLMVRWNPFTSVSALDEFWMIFLLSIFESDGDW